MRILAYLQAHRRAFHRELLEIGGFRYGGRIFELRREGHDIETISKGGLAEYVYHGMRTAGRLF